MEQTPKTAASYIRVSTEDQAEFSPASQQKAIETYASKNGLLLPGRFVFVDEGISGKNAKNRPAFGRMIGLAKTKPRPFDAILLWKFSRFARNQEESIVYKSMLRKLGISVVSISEPILQGAFGDLIERIIEWSDEYYSINLSQEVKRGMEEKARRGGVVSSPPFGYKMGRKVFEIDEAGANAVRMIFESYLGGMGFMEIAALLNDMGIKTRRGNSFDNRGVKYILSNSVYAGKLHWNPGKGSLPDGERREIIEEYGEHTPLISEEIFSRAQEKMARSSKQRQKYARATGPDCEYMLKGLVKCGECGASLVRLPPGSLQCCKYSKGLCGLSHCVSIRRLNEFVIKRLESDLREARVAILKRPEPGAHNFELADSLLKKELAKLEKIKAAYLDGADSLDEYKRNKSEITARIAGLKSQTSRSPRRGPPASPHQKISKSFIELIKSPAVKEAEKNILLKAVIKSVVIHRPENSVDIIYR